MKDETYLTVLLDRSYSMNTIREGVIEGINGFIKEQAQDEKPVKLSLIQFDDQYKVNYTDLNVKEVKNLNKNSYKPRGSTALYYAMARTIEELGQRLAALPENDRPQRVVIVVYSDGEENHSEFFGKQYTKGYVRELVNRQQNVYNWQFLFLGADLDASVGSEIGISNSYRVDKNSSQENFSAVSRGLCSYKAGLTANIGYSVPSSSNKGN